MPTRERRVDRGSDISRRLRATIGSEIRLARQTRGLSTRVVAAAAGCSAASISRLERGLMADVSVDLLARCSSVVGLDLTLRTYPGGHPLRDAASNDILRAFRQRLHPTVNWRSEAPFPNPGDQRRWDGLIWTGEWRFGVECESSPRDWQALAGRLGLKIRDGAVDGVILVLPETRRVREFLQATSPFLPEFFPVPGRRALARIASGVDPGGSSVVVIRRRVRVAAGSPTNDDARTASSRGLREATLGT